jgi:nucleoside-diphosphate-sugar epimerase
MRLLVTGASGWIGRHVVPELHAAGHQVVGLARSTASAQALTAAGVEPLTGDLSDTDLLRTAATDSDGVLHLAYGHDFSRFAEAMAQDAAAVTAFGEALSGSGKPLVIASGTPAVPGALATESDWVTEGITGARGRVARAVVDLAEQDVRGVVVRLPRSVHGAGDYGFIAWLAQIAEQAGLSGYPGDGSARWPAVHVTDAARLFRLAVDVAAPGTVLHAVGDQGIEVREIASALGERLGLPSGTRSAEEIGFLGGMMAVDQPASGAGTEALLDWHPTGPGLLADIAAGHYDR